MMRSLTALLLCAAGLIGQAGNPIQELMDDGHYKRARAAIQARYQEAPNDAETLWRLSRVRQLWGNLDEAQQLAERAVALAPKDARYHFQLAEVVGEKAEKASMIHQIGLGRQFKKEVDLALQLDPKHVGAMKDMMLFDLEAPGIVGGDKNKARTMAQEIAKIDPVEGLLAEIQLAERLKQDPHADELLHKAVAIRPDSYSARVTLGSYLARQKNFEGAAVEAREGIRLNPGRVPAHGLLAVVLVQQDRWTELDTALTQAEKAVPDNFLPYFRAANNCLARKVELPRAERYFRKYLTLEPEPGSPGAAATHWRLGLVLEQMGRKAEAAKEVETSVKADGNNAQAKADLKRLR